MRNFYTKGNGFLSFIKTYRITAKYFFEKTNIEHLLKNSTEMSSKCLNDPNTVKSQIANLYYCSPTKYGMLLLPYQDIYHIEQYCIITSLRYMVQYRFLNHDMYHIVRYGTVTALGTIYGTV